MRGRIYYFTGTGNSMRAARVISGRLKDTEIVSMRSDPKDYPEIMEALIKWDFPQEDR